MRGWHCKLEYKQENTLSIHDELITHAVHGLDVLRVAGILFELLAQPGNMNVNGTRSRHCVIPPNGIKEVVTRMDGAAILYEELEQSELHG